MSHEILQRVRAQEQRLYIPGRGELTVGEDAVRAAVEAYDERFVLAKHNVTGDWVVFVKLGRDDLYPVMGLGPTLPHVDEVRRRMYEADAQRHGTKLLDQVNRHNEEIRKAKLAASDEAIGEAAELMEWGYRKDGEHPSPRIFVPRSL